MQKTVEIKYERNSAYIADNFLEISHIRLIPHWLKIIRMYVYAHNMAEN